MRLPIMLLYREESTLFSWKINSEFNIWVHGGSNRTSKFQSKLFHKFFSIFRLRYGYTWLLLMYLQSKEVIQLSGHVYLELDLHKLGKIMSKFILCKPEDDIINIDLSNYQLAIFPFDKKSLINLSSCETMGDQILCKSVIPSSRCLL